MRRLLGILVILCISLQLFAYDFSAVNNGKTIYYNITSSPSPRTVEVTYQNTSNSGYSGSITIPSSVTYNGNTYSVTSIGNYAFRSCITLTNITIPNSITSIGNCAFQNCKFQSISIPNSVTTIGSSAFSGCNNLTSIMIPNSVTSIKNKAFYGCSGLTSIAIPNSMTNIEFATFSGCSNLTSITIPSSITNIDNTAFNSCSSLNSINVASGNAVYDSRNSCNAIIESSSNTLIIGCKNTIFPSTVTSIGRNAFYGSGLRRLTVPNTITSIGESAFAFCYDLAYITIPNTIAVIEQRTFEDCHSLTSIVLGNSISRIRNQAFNNCTNLASVTLFATMPPSCENAFSGVSRTIPIYVPCGSISSYGSNWAGFSNFIEAVPYLLFATSADDSMGEVSVLIQPTCSDPTATIQAMANSGYHFTHWNDGMTNNPRIVSITQDTTLIAYFAVGTDVENVQSVVQIYVKNNTLYINGTEDDTLVIYDVHGRVVYQGIAEDNNPYKMPQPGVYMVKVGNNPAQKVVIK